LASAALLGPYRLLEPLGQGGMGVVYRARHAATERAVALKTVRIASPRWLESIRREVDALTRIRHPGIVRILDHGVHEGRPWYAMDLLEGESLREYGSRMWSPFRARSPYGLARPITRTDSLSGEEHDRADRVSPVPPSGVRFAGDAPVAAGALSDILSLMRRLCATLAFLHGEGFVSGDLKPENVLLVGHAPILIDFGLSLRFPASTGREAIDAQGGAAGTLPYMSPEQVRGELVDARSDLYSIGCMLYELLTGAAPFVGTPFSIRSQHLSTPPAPPSLVVRDVPPALDSLVLRLLAKEPSERAGFADEVAASLAEIAGDTSRLVDYPPSRPYLYRARFVGRTGTLATLGALRDSAAGGGAMALLAGESGVGKTRLALELTRTAPQSGFRVITSGAFSVPLEQTGTAASPLQTVRPLLRAVADCCQEGGTETTERLLGDRRSVLALYEPLLAEVPASAPLDAIVPLTPDASRQRLFLYLAQTLTAFAEEQPILWVLDDLGWADDLSIAFLHSLTSEYFSSTPAFLLGIYRSEETTSAVRELAGLPHVVNVELPPLRLTDVSAMVADMLALPLKDSGFADYVAHAAEGNPFFVIETVRTAVNERLLYRDEGHTWQSRSADADGRAGFEGLPLPRSLQELIDRRLRALSVLAQETARAAAVLGREFAFDLLTDVAGLSADAAEAAIDELIRGHVFEQPSPDRLRFAHDKLREVAYFFPVEQRRALHARAASVLERRWQGHADAAEVWATLGHHFSAAFLPTQAAPYLKRAAEHARATFANADAIVLYRRAIAEVRAAGENDVETWRSVESQLHEALGDVLAIGGHHGIARSEYAYALRGVDEGDAVTTARLHRKTGKTWEWAGDHPHALSLYTAARETLPPVFTSNALDVRDEWILARFDELRVYYWLARVKDVDALIEELRPVVEKHGTPEQVALFYQSQIFDRMGRERYAISDDTLDLGEMVIRASQTASASERAWAQFQRGFLLLLLGRPREAETDLAASLELAVRAGDVINQARSAVYYAVAARMLGHESDAAERCVLGVKVASDAGMPQYVAAAKATNAWVCLRQGDLDSALTLCEVALAEWTAYGGVYPFQWLALVPRLEAQLARNLLAEAIESTQSLLAPEQRRLPDAVEASLSGAIASNSRGDEPATRRLLDDALAALGHHALR